jgi:hypothetical protein
VRGANFTPPHRRPTRSFESIATVPALGSSSPPRIFMNVDLPQPFAPISP